MIYRCKHGNLPVLSLDTLKSGTEISDLDESHQGQILSDSKAMCIKSLTSELYLVKSRALGALHMEAS